MLVHWVAVIFSLLWASSYACNRNEECAIDESDPVTMGILASMETFTNKLFHRCMYNKDMIMNIVLSPMSIYVVLVFLLFGSAGETQKELIKTLEFPTGDFAELQKTFGDIIIMTDRKRSKNVNGMEFIAVEGFIEPGMFFQKDFPIIAAFSDYLTALNVPINLLDLTNTNDAMNVIMKWIEDSKPKTDSAVSVSVGLNANARVYVTSYFYLTAKWKENLFLDIPLGLVPFTRLDNQVVDVNMMKTTCSLLYYDKKDSYTALEIPFEGEDYVAIFILPYKGVDPIKFATTVTVALLDEFSEQGILTDVDCQIPTLSYSYAFDLNPQLDEWGIKKLFGVANLGNMFDLTPQDFGVQISHYSDITLNELGINANGILSINPVPKPPLTGKLTPFIASRPFLMLIRSAHSHGIVLSTLFYQP